jgi:nucleotide-binding universal stress UspA family protein
MNPNATPARETTRTAIGRSIFSRIVVGIDGSEAGFEACRQIARLADQDSEIDAVAVVHLGPTVAAALDAAHVVDVLEHAVEILGGHDGSSAAENALAVAHDFEHRFGNAVRVITALAGKHVDQDRIREHAGAKVVAQHPVVALVEASRDADLLVVASRGLHGLKALGSVSERVAHDASCTVLVVGIAPRSKECSC